VFTSECWQLIHRKILALRARAAYKSVPLRDRSCRTKKGGSDFNGGKSWAEEQTYGRHDVRVPGDFHIQIICTIDESSRRGGRQYL
jgi:hypothetical protein